MSGPEIVCHTVGSCELRGLKFSFSDKLLSLLKRSDLSSWQVLCVPIFSRLALPKPVGQVAFVHDSEMARGLLGRGCQLITLAWKYDI